MSLKVANLESEKVDNIKFGILFTIVFLLSVFFSTKIHLIIGFGILATLCLMITIVAPLFFRPILRLWISFGNLFGQIISPIVLACIFFIILTPTGFLTRIFGRDELRIKHSTRSTYWIERNESLVTSNSFNDQF
jgi:hypothetical protein